MSTKNNNTTEIPRINDIVPTTIELKNGKTIPYDLETFVKQYEDKQTLPSPMIYCTVTGKKVTAFGTNLHNKVKKAGGIRQLLTTFVGRDASKQQRHVTLQELKAAKAAKDADADAPETEDGGLVTAGAADDNQAVY